jgi:HPt (histidine-containing phosphotransfer) domain-containing protein
MTRAESENQPSTKSKFYRLALTALNWMKWTADSQYSYSSDALDHLSGKTRAALVEPFNKSMEFEKHLPTSAGFDSYMQGRKDSVDKFTKVKVGEETLAQKLTVTDKTSAELKKSIGVVKSSINDALKLTTKTAEYNADKTYKGARGRFEKELTDLKNSISAPNAEYSLAGLTNDLHKIKNKAVSAIKEQQSAEKKELKDLFSNPNFRTALGESLGIKTDDATTLENNIKPIETKMLEELTSSHASELSAFEKSINEPINYMHNNLKARVAFLALIDPIQQNNKLISELAAAVAGDGLGAQQELPANNKSARYKNVDIKDLAEIVTFTGKKITKNGEEGYTLSLPNRIFSTAYYRDSNHNVKADIMLIPLALKARGFESIKMAINHPNKEYARKIAQIAVEACLEAGFKPEDIEITINNDEALSDKKEPGTIRGKLFSDCGSRYEAACQQAKVNAKDWDDAVKKSQEEPTEAYRQEAGNTRAAGEALENLNNGNNLEGIANPRT